MAIPPLRDVLQAAETRKIAIGHFNVGDLSILKAVFEVAREAGTPVIVGTSEGEREFIGTRQIAALVRSLRDEYGAQIYLNADHTHSLESAIAAAKAGFDSIVFDVSSLPYEDNVKTTAQAVEALKSINPAIIVEGEIGDIGTGSEIHEEASAEGGALTTPDEAKDFVTSTRVDALAPAIGNRHGMSRSMVEGTSRKHLAIDRIGEIKAAARCFLTLHGGSGTDDEDFRRAIAAGINIVHVNTELRVAWRRGLEAGLASSTDEVVPYKVLPAAIAAIESVVSSRLALFQGRA